MVNLMAMISALMVNGSSCRDALHVPMGSSCGEDMRHDLLKSILRAHPVVGIIRSTPMLTTTETTALA